MACLIHTALFPQRSQLPRRFSGPDGVIVPPGIVPHIGSTGEEARALAREFDELCVPEYGLRALFHLFELEPGDF
jgi:hypothetical protein